MLLVNRITEWKQKPCTIFNAFVHVVYKEAVFGLRYVISVIAIC